MLAIRPQKVWLTFDFDPLAGLPPSTEDFGDLDYSGHVSAYAKMYVLLKKHGLEAGHFTENHLAAVCRQGKILMERVKYEIRKLETSDTADKSNLILKNFREEEKKVSIQTERFDTPPLRIWRQNRNPKPWSLAGKRVVLVPMCYLTKELLTDLEIKKSLLLGFIDRDPVLQGKSIDGIGVYGYESLPELDPEVVLVASHEQHRSDIVQMLARHTNKTARIVVYEKCKDS